MNRHHVKLERIDSSAWIIIDRPEALNALNRQVIRELAEALDEVAHRPDVRALVLTGSGEKSFIAGADIGEMHTMSSEEAREFSEAGHRLTARIEQLPLPVIAAVNGYALGGGCELALACDVRIAVRKAKFGLPEVGLGIIPGFGGSQRLPRLIGESTAKVWLLTGEPVSAEQACQVGLVAEVVDSRTALDDRAGRLARTFAARSPLAVAKLKRLIRDGMEAPIESAMQLEIETFSGLFDSEDQREGMDAFIEKRKPRFSRQ